jgi:hypothetical protein
MRPLRPIPLSHRYHKPRIYISARYFSIDPKDKPLDLAFDYYEAKDASTRKAPIIFLHGLFGSKKNNRSMSK